MSTESGVPPIVLLVRARDARRDGHIAALEQAGFWVAESGSLRAAAEDISDLRPDVVIACVGAHEHEHGLDALTRALEASSAENAVPLVVIQDEADPQTVLQAIAAALAAPRHAAARAPSVSNESASAGRKPQAVLLDESAPARREAVSVACPSCDCPLVWSQRSTLDGLQYDYYDWCPNGCGLYCFSIATGTWLKLA